MYHLCSHLNSVLFSNLNRTCGTYSTWLAGGQHVTWPAYISVWVLRGQTCLFNSRFELEVQRTVCKKTCLLIIGKPHCRYSSDRGVILSGWGQHVDVVQCWVRPSTLGRHWQQCWRHRQWLMLLLLLLLNTLSSAWYMSYSMAYSRPKLHNFISIIYLQTCTPV